MRWVRPPYTTTESAQLQFRVHQPVVDIGGNLCPGDWTEWQMVGISQLHGTYEIQWFTDKLIGAGTKIYLNHPPEVAQDSMIVTVELRKTETGQMYWHSDKNVFDLPLGTYVFQSSSIHNVNKTDEK